MWNAFPWVGSMAYQAVTAQEGEGMETDGLLCSRNARPQKALVGRAQGKIHQPPSLKR
jgi:hypothetical protein